MPDVLIEVRGDWIGDRKAEFIDAVHGALVKSLKVPAEDKVVRLVQHPLENFAIPKGMGEKYTHIEIAMFIGRSIDARRALYREIVRSAEPFGVPPNDVKIVLIEVTKENVGFRGGKAASDVPIGYETAV
jgi:phenylpyruvate tautomerase PptA (4-oxalocrotonate tautomerase family)